MENKLLNAVKDEYARRLGAIGWEQTDWQEVINQTSWDNFNLIVDTIATRYAAAENQQLRESIMHLREIAQSRLNDLKYKHQCAKTIEDAAVCQKEFTRIYTLLSKTQMYEY